MPTIDLAHTPLRELNATLHRLKSDSNETHWRVLNPRGQHAVAISPTGPTARSIFPDALGALARARKFLTRHRRGGQSAGLALPFTRKVLLDKQFRIVHTAAHETAESDQADIVET